MFKKNVRGFTIVEVLVVVCIIGLLASIIIPNVLKYQENKKDLPAEGVPPRINCTLLGDGVYECKIDNGVVCYVLHSSDLSCLPPNK